jgi:hypothetical protein
MNFLLWRVFNDNFVQKCLEIYSLFSLSNFALDFSC